MLCCESVLAIVCLWKSTVSQTLFLSCKLLCVNTFFFLFKMRLHRRKKVYISNANRSVINIYNFSGLTLKTAEINTNAEKVRAEIFAVHAVNLSSAKNNNFRSILLVFTHCIK